MGENTGIDWATHTFNIWRGCSVVAQPNSGCLACYARVQWEYNHGKSGPDGGPGPKFTKWGVSGVGARLPNPSTFDHPYRWNKAAIAAGRRDRVFSASIADVFDDHDEIDRNGWRALLWKTIWETREGLDWQLLTKRPENIARYLPPSTASIEVDGYPPWGDKGWGNCWLGVSTEHQAAADLRVPVLLTIPAAIYWVSAEPLVGPLDLRRWLTQSDENHGRCLSWVVVGGESCSTEQHTPRRMDLDWARDLLQQCEEAKPSKAVYFFKQHGNFGPDGIDYGLNGYGPDREVVRDGKVITEFGEGKKLDGVLHHNWPRSQMKTPRPQRPIGRPLKGKTPQTNHVALASSRYVRAARNIKSAQDIELAESILKRLRALQGEGRNAVPRKKGGEKDKERPDMSEEVAALIKFLKAAMAPALIGCKPRSEVGAPPDSEG